ncbi:U3 small nucleolar RNA-associated protein 22 [Geosmithia morbida]|uniref:U3 small nucleolar RNA-associated protein 22 n=1 Tax=Geosmithia morbida TaxID=1094350 RepID=A0A9P4YS51_9HYPO|nr:U3 small nucleolar RNA-associated protein 22 [Geosmithia morbida]KAF4121527.1 U3 small nucleolar RNA-associated protein 22 [Geosmithia morbida]
MDSGSGPKRRKLDHSSFALRHAALIDFESRDAARMSTASMFTLQTDELLKGSRVDYAKVLDGVDTLLHRLKGVIDSIPAHEAVPISEATPEFEKKHSISIPYPDPKPPKDAPYKLAFDSPAQCNVVGSYVSRTMVKTQTAFSVDMVVQMPRSLFQEKDYQSMRYFYRRAYYIAYIAAHLRKELGDHVDAEYSLLHDNSLLPILVLRPRPAAADEEDDEGKKEEEKKATKKTKAKPYTVRIIPCAPEDLFPPSKLTPTSANNADRQQAGIGKEKEKRASPFYNSTLKAESTFITYLRLLTKAKTDCPSFADACLLGRIWLQQRGFGGPVSQGGFGHFEWAVMVALLLRSGGRNGKAALSSSLSSTELFKAVIHFLADTDLTKKPLILGGGAAAAAAAAEPGGSPVVYDSSTALNILHRMTPWSAGLLRTHARSTADLLADEAADKFAPIFIMRVNVWSQLYDSVFDIDSPDMLVPTAASSDSRGPVWDYASGVYKVLKRAYGDRAELINIQQPGTACWSLGGTASSQQQQQQRRRRRLVVGVIFNAHNMPRQMERGPPAEEQRDAARFRQFWGDKAELRRFKDGSILECVEWTGRQAVDICEEVTRHALARHVKLTHDEVSFLGGSLSSSIIALSHLDKPAFDAARQAFQTFEHDVRSLEDLPLQIRQLAPVSPLARYTSILPPIPGAAFAGGFEPMDVNMYFEVSSRWPENLIAIQETKIELLLDLDRRLTSAYDTITTFLGRDDRAIDSEANLAYLDVVYDTGAAFRVRIYSDVEETLLERRVRNRSLQGYVRDAVQDKLLAFRWDHSTAPLHTQTVATFCTRLPALSPAIRLAKQWFSSHKLSAHVSDEVIELLVLSVFLSPYPWGVPSSASTAFLRTLDFLSRWDWREDPLILNTSTTDNDDGDNENNNNNNSGSNEDRRASIRRDLETWRKRDPNMNNHAALFIATSTSPSGQTYTRNGPSRLAASRMTRLARAACSLLRDRDVRLNVTSLFEPSLTDYDVLFHLSPKAIRSVMRSASGASRTTRSKHQQQQQFKNLAGSAASSSSPTLMPTRDHPVNVLLSRLRDIYDDTIIFFHGRFDTDHLDEYDCVVAAIWNPKLRTQKFRPGLSYNFARVGDGVDADGDVVEINRPAVLLEIARIAGDLISEIEVVADDDEEAEDDDE